MNFDEQDRQLRSLMARASSPCCGQAGSLSYHFLVGSRITDFVRQISLGASEIAVAHHSLTFSGRTGVAPSASRPALSSLSKVSRGLPQASTSQQKRSVLLLGAAWATKTASASAATNSLRLWANWAVIRRNFSPKGERRSRRSSASEACHLPD